MTAAGVDARCWAKQSLDVLGKGSAPLQGPLGTNRRVSRRPFCKGVSAETSQQFGGNMQKALNKVAPVAFAVSALGGALGEDTAAGFILMACGAVVLGVCVWLMIYRT